MSIGPRNEQQPPRKILVAVGEPRMGGAVEVLPVFEMIQERWPDAYLGAAYFEDPQRSVFETSPHISETIRLFGGVQYAHGPLRGLRLNRKAMQGFDTVLFLYKEDAITWPMRLAAKLAGARLLYKHGYRYRDHRRNIYSDFPAYVFYQIVASNLLLESPLVRLRQPNITFLEPDHQFAADFFHRTGWGAKPTVIINSQSEGPGAHADWGIEKYARVANGLVDWGARVIINGGADHQIEEFKSVAPQLRNGVALLEKPSPRQLAAVFSKCDLYIGAANGPSSVAMAVGTPTITLVGAGEYRYPGQEPIGPMWWPRGPHHKVISRIDWCHLNMGRECRCRRKERLKGVMRHLHVWKLWKKTRKRVLKFLGMYRHGKIPPCLEAITVEEVVEQAKEQLGQGRPAWARTRNVYT